ncbi:PREDICTED: protein TEX261 [Nicrophorus vespilloides]|uniref:Protein TEX261 n=1 Tax=Nicrophorus vespilloides TaxID=110193 RepID=A0ABM1NIJ0_NICVS|nr:PREDICTED: protein TEX261 [Nicrophorus vespilloides]
MWFLTILTYLAFTIQICFITVGLASGLLYLAEVVEEYTVIAKQVITWANSITLIVFILLWAVEGFPNTLSICGILSQINHFLILQKFPYVSFLSPTFITAISFIVVNHYLAFQYFGTEFYSFSEVMAYFTICLWIVPFALFVSLSANDYVLPTSTDRTEGDVVTNYFSKKGKRYGVLSLFNYAKESLLPSQRKKGF